jgi:hypothetical protein
LICNESVRVHLLAKPDRFSGNGAARISGTDTRESKIVAGITLIIIPTIIYGGTTLLSLVAGYGTGKGLTLDPTQIPLWRAGHGHAGVLVILTLILQPLVDAT